MTALNLAPCLDQVLLSEGGYVNHLADPGGPTNLGITQATLSSWLGQPATIEQVKGLRRVDVAPIYRALYWAPVGADLLADGLDLMVFDTAVNMGVGTAARMLQGACGAVSDGHVGPLTAALAASIPVKDLIESLSQRRELRYRGLVNFTTFGTGWLNRLAVVTAKAMEMA